VGTIVLYGKWKNHRGKVVGFGSDKYGNPTVEIEPIPKGRKSNKILGLYRIWRADVKEKALAEKERADVSTLRVAARFERIIIARYKQKKQVRSEGGGKTTVYLYSERQIQHRNREKAKRLEKLSKSIKDLQAKVKKDLKSDDPEKKLTSLVIALMNETSERVGNEESASGKSTQDGEKHYGVTGWKRKHISFKPNEAVIRYIGKSGVKQEKRVIDSAIRKALRDAYEADDDKDADLFAWDGGKITAEKVNNYLKSFDITAKDIRGFKCNSLMREALERLRKDELPKNKKERKNKLKSEFNQALKEVAEQIGHEVSTLKSDYLVPHMQEAFEEDGTIINKLDD
jgi:DNA topoisomerase-1